MKNERKGISLIVLIITIIIVIIIATAVIVNISKSNPIKKAKEAMVKRNIAEYTQLTNVIILTSQTELYEKKEESLIDIIKRNIEKEKWYESSSMYDDNGFLVGKSGTELIVKTKDKYEICIKVNGNIAYVEYVSDKPLETFTLTYESNNGSGDKVTENVREGRKIILRECAFKKEGYKFIGWSEQVDSEEIYLAGALYPKEGIKKNLTLYARWEKDTVDIIYNGNGGMLSNADTSITKSVKPNSKIYLPQNTFTKTMYDFAAWVAPDGKEYQPGDQYNLGEESVEFSVKWEYKIVEELSYLRTTGYQYIDTGVIPNQDTTVEMKFMLLSREGQHLFGIGQGTSTNKYSFGFSKAYGSLRSDYNNTLNAELQPISNAEIHTVRKEKNRTYIDGVLKDTQTYASFSAPSNLSTGFLLFNANINGSIDSSLGADIKFYYCKIWDNETLIRDFVPVIDNKGKVCVYDKLEDKLYYAKGTGELEKPLKDSEYSELKSIKVQKNYVDTGFTPNQDTTVEMKFVLLSKEGQYLFGIGKDTSTNKYSFGFTKANDSLRSDYNNTVSFFMQKQISTMMDIHTVRKEKNRTYIDGVLKDTQTYASFSAPSNLSTGLLLFNANINGSISSYGADIIFYYCKIWDNGALIRDYIAALDYNNEICLYDKVENKKYKIM